MNSLAPEWFYLLSPIAALAVMVVVQAVVLRARGGERFFGSVVAGFLAGLFTVFALQVVLLLVCPRNFDRWVLALVANPAIFVMLSYCFFNFINLGHASIRIRIFKECDDRGGFITREELRSVYDDELIKQARLQRLLEGGDIVRDNERWKLINPRLVPVANIVFGLKKFVLQRESEFDVNL
ncbi:MAG: hypothetical protein WCQ57_06505 [Verrucomicrobiota bacterium]